MADSRRRRSHVLLLLLSLVVGVLLVLGTALHADAGQVYAVAQVEAGLRLHPARWLGRTVTVEGVYVSGFTSCGIGTACVWIAQPMLVAMPRGASAQGSSGGSPAVPSPGAIALRSGQPNTLLTLLRRLPLISHMLPGPAFSRLDTRYLVRLGVADASTTCMQWSCYQATLLDGAVPNNLPESVRSSLTMVGSTLILQPASGVGR